MFELCVFFCECVEVLIFGEEVVFEFVDGGLVAVVLYVVELIAEFNLFD